MNRLLTFALLLLRAICSTIQSLLLSRIAMMTICRLLLRVTLTRLSLFLLILLRIIVSTCWISCYLLRLFIGSSLLLHVRLIAVQARVMMIRCILLCLLIVVIRSVLLRDTVQARRLCRGLLILMRVLLLLILSMVKVLFMLLNLYMRERQAAFQGPEVHARSELESAAGAPAALRAALGGCASCVAAASEPHS